MFINTSKIIIPYKSDYGNNIKIKGAGQPSGLFLRLNKFFVHK